MIAVAVIAGALPAVLTRAQRGKTVTPDGKFYEAMGRGEIVPRPYALRSIAKVIPHWEGVTIVAFVVTIIGLYWWASAMYDSTTATIACGLYGALPSTRRLLVWPVLLDALSQACIVAVAVLSLYNPLAALLLALCCMVVHERVPVWGALMVYATAGLVWLPLFAVAIAYVIHKSREEACEGHPLEHTVDWLRDPVKTCLANHLPHAHDWRMWILPWGASLAWMMKPTTEAMLATALSYASLLVSMDRVRTYQAAPFIVVCCAAVVIPPELAMPAIVATSFIPDKVI